MGMWAEAELILNDALFAKLLFAAAFLVAEGCLIGLILLPFDVGEPAMLVREKLCFVYRPRDLVGSYYSSILQTTR